VYGDPQALPLDDVFCKLDEMPYNFVGRVGPVVKVHVDVADASIEEELAIVPVDQLASARVQAIAYRSLFSLTTRPTCSSLNTFITHRKAWFGYLLFGFPLAIVFAAARAARLA
jgi:hypothetical protein